MIIIRGLLIIFLFLSAIGFYLNNIELIRKMILLIPAIPAGKHEGQIAAG